MNKYGLSRNIPAEIKREVRQRCGFGCVICGLGIYQYEHVDPLYVNAKEHNPKYITLLCPGCHIKVTNGFWSKSKVKDSMQHPYCRSSGFSREVFDIGNGHPEILFAGSTFINTAMPIVARGIPLIVISQDNSNGLFSISANFWDTLRRNTLRIIENEWQALASNWDVNVVGSRIQIRENPGKIVLELLAKPPDRIIITKLKMVINGLYIQGDPERIMVLDLLSGYSGEFKKCISSNARIGFSLN